MSNFENMKKKILEENEKNFGEEVREKYGDEAYEASNQIIMGLTEEQWLHSEELRKQAESMLYETVRKNIAADSEEGKKTAELHGKWASMFWEDGAYSKEAHLLLASMYLEDERFKKYYDSIINGGAEFLSRAIQAYCS